VFAIDKSRVRDQKPDIVRIDGDHVGKIAVRAKGSATRYATQRNSPMPAR
jgi:hypothetical protein